MGCFQGYSSTSLVSVDSRSVLTQRGWGHLPGLSATGLQMPCTGQRWMVKARDAEAPQNGERGFN